jgi:hypothetical protein
MVGAAAAEAAGRVPAGGAGAKRPTGCPPPPAAAAQTLARRRPINTTITGNEVIFDQEETVSTRSDVELVATVTDVSELAT